MNENFITPIQFGVFQATSPLKQNSNPQGNSTVPVFSDYFSNAVNMVKETEKKLEEKQYLLATGQLDSPHELMAASSEAGLAVDLLVQLRSKALESYNELMRISL